MRLRNIPEARPAVEVSPYVVHNPRAMKGSWKKELTGGRPLYLEIGMGKGKFIMGMAEQNPEVFCVGMEKYHSVLYRGLQKMEEGPIGNVAFLCEDAALCEEFFEPGEVDRIFLNFSDPWPKDRHADRRLTSARFFERYAKILKKGGELQFKTDNRGLFDFSVEVLKEGPSGFVLTDVCYDLHGDSQRVIGNIMTEYEEKFSSMGNPIFKLVARFEPEES